MKKQQYVVIKEVKVRTFQYLYVSDDGVLQ